MPRGIFLYRLQERPLRIYRIWYMKRKSAFFLLLRDLLIIIHDLCKHTAASGHPLHPLQISIHINNRILLFLDTGAYFDRSL